MSAWRATGLVVLLATSKSQVAACFQNILPPGGNGIASSTTAAVKPSLPLLVPSPAGSSSSAAKAEGASAKTKVDSYWDQPHADVPPQLLRQIREGRWRGGLEPAKDQSITEVPASQIEGAIPKELVGTMLRMGPGRIRIGDTVFGHYYDGDGYVSKIIFTEDGKVYAQGKYVHTPIYTKVEMTSKPRPMSRMWTKAANLLRNPFAQPTTPCNTAVQVFSKGGGGNTDLLLAICEAGQPIQLDKMTLRTVGAYNFEGNMKSYAYSGRPSIDAETGFVYNHGTIIAGMPPFAVNVMRISADAKISKQNAIPYSDRIEIVHDNVLTKNYFIFLSQPYVIPSKKLYRCVTGSEPAGNLFEWKEERGTTVFFVDKGTLELAAKIKMPQSVSSANFVAAFEPEDGKVVVDLLQLREGARRTALEDTYKDLYHKSFTQTIQSDVHRYEFDLRAGTCKDVINFSAEDQPGSRRGELCITDPRYGGKRVRFAFGACQVDDASGFWDGIFRLDLDTRTWSTHRHPKGSYGSGPIFVPRSPNAEEADGYILSTIYIPDTHTSDIVILDTRDFEGPPVAVVHLPFHFAFDLHGLWLPNDICMRPRR